MSFESQRYDDWGARMRLLMRDDKRFPWLVFAIGFVLGAWIF